jgi:glycosyltransferase involved in cell wall biosynthesis
MNKTVLIINDNSPKQINGVVRTMNSIKSILSDIGDYTIIELSPHDFKHISGIFYPDLNLVWWPWNIGNKIAQINPDYIHIVTEGPLGLAAKLACDQRKWKYTTSFHTRWDLFINEMIGFNIPGIQYYLKWFHNSSNKVLVTTKSMNEQLKQIGIYNTAVWSRGVNRNMFEPRLDIQKRLKPVLLNVGRVSPEKNLEDFLMLDSNIYDLVLVGDGPSLNGYKEKYPHVRYTGVLYGEALAKEYANADVFVFPSKSDTFGLVMLESMACGTPIAAYPVPGPIDVVENGLNGYINEHLEQAIQDCLKINRYNVSKESEKWSWESVTKTFIDNLVLKNG